jgi:CheY-like chemotaxis protein
MEYGPVRPYILVAEDDEDCARAVSVILADQYEVEVLSSGREVVSTFAVERPDLLILDYQLPDMNGVRLIETLRRRCAEDVAAVMMSAYSNRRDASRRAGFELFLQKPFDRSELLQIVERALPRA